MNSVATANALHNVIPSEAKKPSRVYLAEHNKVRGGDMNTLNFYETKETETKKEVNMAYKQEKCPSCGALLKADAEKKIAVCEYCGSSLIKEDEEKETEAPVAKKEAEKEKEAAAGKSAKKPWSKNKKRLVIVITVAALLLVALITTLIVVAVVDSQPPALEELRPRIEALLEAAYRINDVIWGEGLPTHPRAYMKDIVATPMSCECHAAYQKEIDPENAPGQMYLNYYHLVVQDEAVGEVIVYQSFFRYMEQGKTVYTYAES